VAGNPDAPETVSLNWSDGPRADRYRAWRQLPGETEPAAIGTITESELQLDGQPTGVPIKFSISAVNDAGESAQGEEVTITLAVSPPGSEPRHADPPSPGGAMAQAEAESPNHGYRQERLHRHRGFLAPAASFRFD
jgi:hypothetical protein